MPVVIILPDAEAGNRFVLHTSANSQEGFDAGPATIADQKKKAVVQGLVGLGNVFWLVRSDGVSSPAYAVAQSGSEVDLSQAGYFPADYMPAWASTLFRIGGARAGHSFTVRHLNGIQVPFPIPANLWTGHVTTPNSDGATVDRQFYETYIDIDQKQDWSLWDESISPAQKLGRVPSAGDGSAAWHVSVPAGRVSLNIPEWRKSHPLKLQQNFANHDVEIVGDYTATGAFLTGTRYSLQGTPQYRTYSFQYVPALADGDPAQPFVIVDGDEVFDCGANERSPAEWYRPELLTLTLNAGRWEHELYVRQFDGTQFPIERRNQQGGWFYGTNGTGVFTSFGVFEGLAWKEPLLDYTIFDRTTQEMATAAQLASLAGWGSDNKDTDGDGLSDWYELLHGTLPNVWDTDGDGYRT